MTEKNHKREEQFQKTMDSALDMLAAFFAGEATLKIGELEIKLEKKNAAK